MHPSEPDAPAIDALWDYANPVESELHFRQLLSQLTPQTSAYRETMTQIARAQGLQRQFTAAHQTLDAVQAQLPPTPDRTSVRYLLERGRVFNASNHPADAHILFLRAWEHAQTLQEDFYAIDSAHMLAIVETGEQQHTWNLRALALAEHSTQARAQEWRGSLYNNIGWTYHDQGRYEEALTMFQRAEQHRAERNQPRELRIARWCVARTLRSLGKLTDALAIQHALAAESEQSGEPDGYIYEELAECLLQLDQPHAAQPYFAHAHRLLAQDPWFAAQEPARLARLEERGRAQP